MKLDHPFVQLPLLFDAPALAAEIAALGESVWMPHPQGFAGNSMLPLVASEGDPADESFAGQMMPTPHLEACPYLGRVIASLGTVVGRTRLMRLSGHAEVTRHADQGYYWADRVRVHVPITTQPTVRFECEDTHTHMAAGECWIFDTWRQHRVLNDDTRERIHLVVDTVGSEEFWALVKSGRTHEGRLLGSAWSPRTLGPDAPVAASARYESANLPVVMSPWEMAERLYFLLGEAQPHPSLEAARALTDAFVARWRFLWAEHGDRPSGWPVFRAAAEAYLADILRTVGNAPLRNNLVLASTISSIVRRVAVSGEDAKPHYLRTARTPGDPAPAKAAATPAPAPGPAVGPAAPASPARPSAPPVPVSATPAFGGWGLPGGVAWGAPAAALATRPAAAPAPAPARPALAAAPAPMAVPPVPGPRADGRDPVFERPVFIVSSPRAGSTMLFEALASAPGVFTIGGESHALIEGVPALNPANRGFDSNRLEADMARPEIAQALRQRFLGALRDRHQRPPAPGPLRMLEKTPKNSLRIPFLSSVFPEGIFIYLYRDPRETLASMIEAWSSGRFRTYPNLPGWTGPQWSLLLVPGWRGLVGRPLPDVVAAQWETATRLMLDDLEALPAQRRLAVRYDALVADPQGELARLAGAVGLGWDRAVDGGLPLSRYTLTEPKPDKWRKHEAEILPRLAGIQATMDRAARFAGA